MKTFIFVFMRILSILIISLYIPQLTAQVPGEINDTIVCRTNHQQYYALYLPKDYTEAKQFPLVLFFDPAGRGEYPLERYRSLADRYKLIMACSYQSRNGPFQPSIDAAYAMLTDISDRFSVNRSLTLVSGFSGGARLASSLAIRDKQFSGVIACGATFPSENKITSDRKLPYAIVIGDHDMNFLEGIATAQYLNSINSPQIEIYYKGDHRWPSADVFEEALVWHLLQKDILAEAQIEKSYQSGLRKIEVQMDSGNWFFAQESAQKLIIEYNRYLNTSTVDSLLEICLTKHDHSKDKRSLEKLWRQEEQWRKQFYAQYNNVIRAFNPDTAFKANDWVPFANELIRLRSSKTKYKKMMGYRLFDFSWRLCAEQSSLLFKQKDYKHALLSAHIWSTVAPQDHYAWLMLARIQASQSLPKETLQLLKKAFENGFREKELLEKDSVFNALRETSAYQNLIKQY